MTTFSRYASSSPASSNGRVRRSSFSLTMLAGVAALLIAAPAFAKDRAGSGGWSKPSSTHSAKAEPGSKHPVLHGINSVKGNATVTQRYDHRHTNPFKYTLAVAQIQFKAGGVAYVFRQGNRYFVGRRN